MNQRKSTFEVSPQKRPVTQRLTPLAWIFIGILGLALVVGCTACTLALVDRPTDEPWDPTATPTPAPTETPVAPAGPSPTPTVWYQDIVTPTVAATETVAAAHPAWWSDQMTQDDEGNWWPPEEVAEMVKEHRQECGEIHDQYLVETTPPDIEGYEAVVATCYTGENLESQLSFLDHLSQGDNTIVSVEWETCHVQVQEWSEDGLECTLGITCSAGTINEYDHTGELISTEYQEQGGLALTRRRYDPTDGRWKQLRVVDYIPPQ
jgi:hypothetical protein